MHNSNIALVLVLLVGCGTVPVSTVDAGVLPDAEVVSDAEVQDAGEQADAAGETDSGARTDAAVDAGPSDGGARTDAEADAATPDAGVAEDAGAPSDAGVDAPMMDAAVPDLGTPIDIGVSGNGSCLLTDDSEMWCWGFGNSTPVYVADAVAIEGTCGIAVDGHVFCWGGGGVIDHAGTDAAVVGVQTHVSRVDGLVRTIGLAAPTYDPPGSIVEMPALNCAIFTDGALTCWDRVLTTPPATEYRNFWNAVTGSMTYDVQDVARRGTFEADTSVICYTWTGSMPRPGSPLVGPGIYCATERGTTGSTLWTGATEVEINGGRACALTPTGVHCASDRPALFTEPGHWPLNPLPGSDPYFNESTSVVGDHLALGTNHACLMQGSSIVCWGDNSGGQLGNGTTTSSRTPVTVAW